MIVPSLARMIVREHMYKPITGKILILGRQTIGMTYDQFLLLLKQEHYVVPDNILKNVKNEHDNRTRAGKGTDWITDEVFFKLLGINIFHVMDVSSYEGADIIHNLNDVIPASLENQFDFIIDGGTFDHLFDLRNVFENVVKMLKVGGRIFQWNASSNFIGGAYLSFGPDIFYDYYCLNSFADCKVYLAELDNSNKTELWNIYEFQGDIIYNYFYSKGFVMVIVMAEKGPDSTFHLLPVQRQYRDPNQAQKYTDNQKVIASSSRKPWVGSELGKRAITELKIVRKGKQAVNKAALKYKEGGFDLVYRKVSQEISKSINRTKKRLKGQVDGYKYVGKI